MSLKSKMFVLNMIAVVGVGVALAFFIRGAVKSEHALTNSLKIQGYMNEANLAFDDMAIGMRGYLLDPTRKVEWDNKLKADDAADAVLKKAALESQNPELTKYLKMMSDLDGTKLNPLENEFGDLIKKGNKEAARNFYFESYQPVKTQMEEILDRARESARMAADKADSDLRWFLTTGAYCLAGFIIFALGVSFVFSTRIAGDLTSRISKLAAELDHSVHALELASKGTAHASQQIATSATENASAITETLSIADNGRKESERGKAVVNQMAGAVREVYEANSTLESLIKVIDDIKSKTRVINDIVFETRLLSFNASIEAARAGVHGKGFAVVAEEVGKLAAVSGKASEEITKLLENSVQQVREVVTTTSQRVNSARESSQQCETVFTQMSEALEEINNAMRNMEQVTHQNSASSEELANQASALASETKNLATSTQLLRSIVGGKDDAETTARKTEDHHFHEEHVPHSESPGFADGAPAMTVDELTAAPARTNVKRTDIRWKAS